MYSKPSSAPQPFSSSHPATSRRAFASPARPQYNVVGAPAPYLTPPFRAIVPDENNFDFEEIFNGDFGVNGFTDSTGAEKERQDPVLEEVGQLDDAKRWAAVAVSELPFRKDGNSEAVMAESAVVHYRIALINRLLRDPPRTPLCIQVISKRKEQVSVGYRLLEERLGALYNAQTQVTWPADIEWSSLHPISHRYAQGGELPSNVTGALHLMVVRSIMSACRDASTKKLRDIYWALGMRDKPLQFTQIQDGGTGMQTKWELPETLHSITHTYHARVDTPEHIQTEPIDVIVYWGIMKINYCDQWHNPLINAYVRNTVLNAGRTAIREMQDWHEADDKSTKRHARSFMHNYLRPVIRIQHGHRIHVLSLAPFFGPDTCSVEHILVEDRDDGILDLVNKDIRDVGFGRNVQDSLMHFYHCVGTKPNARYNEQQLNYLHASALAPLIPAHGRTRAAARLGAGGDESQDPEDTWDFRPSRPAKKEPRASTVPAKHDSDEDEPRPTYPRHQKPRQRDSTRAPEDDSRDEHESRATYPRHQKPRGLPWAPKPQPRRHTEPPAPKPRGHAWAQEPKHRDATGPQEQEPEDDTGPQEQEPGDATGPQEPEPEEATEPEEQEERQEERTEPQEQEERGPTEPQDQRRAEPEETQNELPKPSSKDAKSARISFTDWDVLVSSYKFKGLPTKTLITLVNYPPHGMRYTKDAMHVSSPEFRSTAPDKKKVDPNEAFWVKWYSKEKGQIFEWNVNLIDKDPRRSDTYKMREHYARVRLSVQLAMRDTATGGTWWIESPTNKHKFVHNIKFNEKKTIRGTALEIYQKEWREFFTAFIERQRGQGTETGFVGQNYLWVSNPDKKVFQNKEHKNFRKINAWEEILGEQKRFAASWEQHVEEQHKADVQEGLFRGYKLSADMQDRRPGGGLCVEAADRLPIVPRPASSALLERIKALEAAKLEDARKAQNREHMLCKMLERLAPPLR